MITLVGSELQDCRYIMGQDEPPSDPGLLLGGFGNGLFNSALLPVFIKSPACKSVGFSRCDRFSWIRNNDDVSSEQGFRVGDGLRFGYGSGDILGIGE
jgi:hypothetical protein